MMLKLLTRIALVVGERVRTSCMLLHIQITKFDPSAHLYPSKFEQVILKLIKQNLPRMKLKNQEIKYIFK